MSTVNSPMASTAFSAESSRPPSSYEPLTPMIERLEHPSSSSTHSYDPLTSSSVFERIELEEEEEEEKRDVDCYLERLDLFSTPNIASTAFSAESSRPPSSYEPLTPMIERLEHPSSSSTHSYDPLTSSSVFERIELEEEEEEEKRDVDCYLERLDLCSTPNIMLVAEIIVGFLALFSTDTLSAFGGNVNYFHWSCGAAPSALCMAVTGEGRNYSKETLCIMKERNPLFQLEDDGASFRTEFGMICEREKESKVLVDVSGIGSGAGYLVGGMFCDMFGRRLGLKISSVGLLLTVVMTILADSIQFFTLCLFMQGFTTSMTIISFLVLLVELLPYYRARLAVCMFGALRHVGVLLAFAMRAVTQRSWRGFALCLLVLDLSVVGVTMHIPASPRFKITCKDQYRAKHSLSGLGIKLGERSVINIPTGASEHWVVMNFFKHRRLIFEVFLLYTLWAIVGTASNVPAGKVWQLVKVENAQYCIKALVDLCGVPIALILLKYNVSLSKAITGLGWSMIVCYFIGIIPLGGGVFTVENVDGYCSEVILQAIRVILLLATIESSPTSQRGMLVGGLFVVELSFRKIGSLLIEIVISDVTEIIYGVLFLVFVYVTSFLSLSSEQKLVNTLEESKLRNLKVLDEDSKLLNSTVGLNQIDLSFLK